jgi:hypothetical protein
VQTARSFFNRIDGAGGGNRTRDSCLEGKGITTMQRPRRCGPSTRSGREHLRAYAAVSESFRVRRAAGDDVEAIRRIYNEGVEDRVATLESDPKSREEMAPWWMEHDERYVVLVATES